MGLWPTAGDEPQVTFSILEFPIGLALNPADEAIMFLRTTLDSRSLWNQALAGSEPELVLDLGTDRVYDFAWSVDGRLAVAHGPGASGVVMITMITGAMITGARSASVA